MGFKTLSAKPLPEAFVEHLPEVHSEGLYEYRQIKRWRSEVEQAKEHYQKLKSDVERDIREVGMPELYRRLRRDWTDEEIEDAQYAARHKARMALIATKRRLEKKRKMLAKGRSR